MHDANTIDELVAAVHDVARACDTQPDVGLWLSPAMLEEDRIDVLKAGLDAVGVRCIGLNGFPAMSFRDDVVKTAVYRPAWDDPARLDYTLACAAALLRLLPPGSMASITTCPVGWPAHDVDCTAAAAMLRQACIAIDRLAADARCSLHLAIEPEPGCILNTTASAAEFVRSHDLRDLAADGLLRVCLDTCHMAVQHEVIPAALQALQRADLQIGRIQVSNAPQADLPDDAARDALAALVEPRWMHQTTVHDGAHRHDFPDLPEALDHGPDGNWRTHLHVPVHLDAMGPLQTTRRKSMELLQAVAATSERPAVEVETYAWSVVPDAFRAPTLADDIAAELGWTNDMLQQVNW